MKIVKQEGNTVTIEVVDVLQERKENLFMDVYNEALRKAIESDMSSESVREWSIDDAVCVNNMVESALSVYNSCITDVWILYRNELLDAKEQDDSENSHDEIAPIYLWLEQALYAEWPVIRNNVADKIETM